MAKRDYYDVLGINRSADEKEIKRAYRKLAKKYHPDINPGDKQAEQKFKELTEAYNVLSDAEKKKLYDRYGFEAFEEGFRPGQDQSGDMGDMGDIFGDIFGDLFHGNGGSGFRFRTGGFGGAFRQRGADARADIRISFDEAVFGCDKVFQIREENGKVSSLQVHIPAGIDEGQSVRLKGKGEPGIGGGAAGDLMLKVHIAPKQGYERKGKDVYVTVSIPYTTAVLGGEAIVPTLTGKVSCKIAAGEILTHRTDVVMLDVEDSMEEWQDIIYGSRHTLYPVCEGSPDRIIGILDAGRYFRLENQDRKTVMERAVHPAYFIPDTVKADTLFRNMKQKKQTMAVVLDEYGGMSGIITIKDLVERLVGDICFHGEEEEEETTVKAIEEGVWLVPGSAWIKEVSEVLGTTLPCEDCDTFSGLILHALGSIPEDGTDMELEVAGLRIQVTQIRNHQVGMAVVSLLRE